MSTVSDPAPMTPPSPPANDPYRYGWRYVQAKGPDGEVIFEQIPLSAADLLHPEEEDFIVQCGAHNEDCYYLKNTFASRLRRDPEAKVFCDHRITWDVPRIGAHGPDVFVVFGLKSWNGERGTFPVAELKVRPKIVVEVTSRYTRNNDLIVKKDQYYRVGVPLYVIADAYLENDPREPEDEGEHEPRLLRIIGYRRGPRAYEEIPLNDRGWLWLEDLKLWVGTEGGRVVCYDENKVPIEDPLGQTIAREEAEKRAAEETEARKKAEARASNEAKKRTRAEAKAGLEVKARLALEAKVRELEEALKKRDNDPR